MAGQVEMGQGAEQVVDLAIERVRRGRSQERWVPKTTVADHFGVSPRTVERWINDPRYTRDGRNCPHRRIFGSPVRFQIGQVELWLDQPEDPR
jgi:hypothetical protein